RIPAWRAWFAFRHATLGDVDEARVVLAPLIGERLAGIPRDESWLITLANIGRAAVLLGNLDAVRLAYQTLEPYAARHVVAGGAVAYGGPVTFFLGNLAAALGDLDCAQEHLSTAIAAAADARSPPWQARATVSLANVLLRTGDADAGPRAREL